jgi:hypothetical protein
MEGVLMVKGQWDDDYERYRYRTGCFGLPYGGLIWGLILGSFLILIGISLFFGFDIWRYLGTIILILLGILIILGALFGYGRRRRR